MRRPLSIALATALLALTACSGADQGAAPPAASEPPPSAGATPSSAAPSASSPAAEAPTPTATPAPSSQTPAASAPRSTQPARKPNPISVAALITKTYNGDNLKLGRLLEDRGEYRRYLVTYRSEDLTVSGIMHVPDGKGPFPVVVLNHGYIDPDVYRPGQGMPREQDYLARNGYVVLHTDYRGHASGEEYDNNRSDYALRLPYSVDTINAVYAIKRSKLPFLDGDRVGWFGRSMGGAVTLTALVAQPGLVDAAVVYASTSSLAADNWRQFSRDGEDQDTNRRIERTYGLPNENPAFWRAASARPYFSRVTEPVMFQHGIQDDTCPISWTRESIRALRAAGKDVSSYFYPNEGHTFEEEFGLSIRRTRAFFDRELR